MTMMIQEMVDMKLHDMVCDGGYEVTRVPGGWIYLYLEWQGNNPETGASQSIPTSTFVPEPALLPTNLKEEIQLMIRAEF